MQQANRARIAESLNHWELNRPVLLRPDHSTYVPKFSEVVDSKRGNRFLASSIVHVIAALVLVRIGMWLPTELARPEKVQVTPITLLQPDTSRPEIVKPPPAPSPKMLAKLRVSEHPDAVIVPIRMPEKPPEQVTKAPEAPKIEAKAVPLDIPKPLIPKKPVAEGMFDSGSSAKPTVDLPKHEVQTGGFGDPNGVGGKSQKDGKLTVASVGAFDLPSGGGQGNGSGGTKGARGTVASAGFGDGVAGTGSGDRPSGRSVSTGGFGDAAPAVAPAKQIAQKAQVTPVEILYKPRPVYNEEARKQHVEGEVLLDVMFAASGELRVQRVVRGLGHGLDDSAIRSAQQIRFRPAMRAGQPVDSNAVVHIVFALAE